MLQTMLAWVLLAMTGCASTPQVREDIAVKLAQCVEQVFVEAADAGVFVAPDAGP
jgi:hypothetical protein